jgi:DMSO/TMAO reductase YedYZ molybdopterin-dependent catalytic subunit
MAIVESMLGRPGLVPYLWIALLLGAWGAVVGRLLERQAEPAPAGVQVGRRRALAAIAAGSAGAALGAWGLARLLGAATAPGGAGQKVSEAVPNLPEPTPLPTPAGRIEPVPGTRPELTATDDFYRIDINTIVPHVNGASWTLEVKGLFGKPRTLTLADLLAFSAVTQPITLQCISNPVGGDLMSTGYFTGVRLRDVVADLGLKPDARALFLKAADGFSESVVLQDVMDARTLLVYGMNGEPLTSSHGYPLRIYIPNRYGMKQPKWIVSMEAIDEPQPGYWVKRGWSQEARPQIVSVIDAVSPDNAVDGKVPVGGIAWAGDRGIQKVEVQVDDGEWVEAELREPTLSPLTWVQWRYDWPASPGRHTFRVRATDGTGALQIADVHDTFPDGATGYHSYESLILQTSP